MTAAIAALFRHPIKGFTPEKLDLATLAPQKPFPGDRLYVLEDGPSGFDPGEPKWIPKQKFAVLAKIAEVAKAHTRLDDVTGLLHAEAEGHPAFRGDLSREVDRTAFAAWAGAVLGGAAQGPLRVLDGEGYRFLDHPLGHISILNLASVRDFGDRLGLYVDPLRFRANLYVDGWPAWAENDWEGRTLRLGEAEATVFKAIVRCAAPGVDPSTAIRDLDVTAELHRLYGHLLCGIYVHVTKGGVVRPGDEAIAPV